MRNESSARESSSSPAFGDVPRRSDPSPGAGDAIDRLGPEVATVLREGLALERKGLLDAQATERIEARLQALYEAQMQDLMDRQESAPSASESRLAPKQSTSGEEWRPGYRASDPEFAARMEALQQRTDETLREIDRSLQEARDRSLAFRAKYGIVEPARRGPPLPLAFSVPLAIAGVLGAASGILAMVLGEAFIWFSAAGYGTVAPWLFLAALPLVAVMLYRAEQAGHSLRNRYPTWFVRWLFVYPVTVLLFAGMLVASPMGWSAALGWGLGTSSRTEVRLVSLGTLSPGTKGCDQSAYVEFKGTTSRICLEGRLQGKPPNPGETVAVSGRISRWGLYVQRIHGR
ncbi:hypothetical protein HNP48_004962 [Acidovorax soli]|uniref:Uncharacterized protein n=1 Tax=Acidovorax soli TaxID=592050 RepID=A0A7X0PHX7_9BURK|nr:hypothetical protein [Acidovorax soli]MBB6562253.1 hypothetical protein [Acidovorax soli]